MLHSVIEARIVLHANTETEVLKWAVSEMSKFYNRDEDEFNFMIRGRRVCPLAWRIFYSITHSRYYVARQHVINDTIPIHGNCLREYKSIIKDNIRTWFDNYIELYGDHQPDGPHVYLSPGLNKIGFFNEWMDFTKKQNTLFIADPLQMSSFMKIWRKDYPNLMVQKNTTLGYCDYCSKIDVLIEQAKTVRLKQLFCERKRSHHERFKEERAYLDRLSSMSNMTPELSWFVATDSMAPMRLPWHASMPKSLLNVQRPKMNVFGLLDASFKQRYYFTYFDWWGHDANIHISLLWWHFYNLRKNGVQCLNFISILIMHIKIIRIFMFFLF
jgi:hypothetical protein